MKELIINERFKLICPQGFREMTEAERDQLNMLGDGDTLCLISEEGHMVVSIGWKQVNAVAGLLLHLISPARSMEASVNQAMSAYGYRRDAALERQIGGQSAKGFRYSYTAQVPMVGESYVLRDGRSLTFFHAYTRDALREESLAAWQRLLDAVEPL